MYRSPSNSIGSVELVTGAVEGCNFKYGIGGPCHAGLVFSAPCVVHAFQKRPKNKALKQSPNGAHL